MWLIVNLKVKCIVFFFDCCFDICVYVCVGFVLGGFDVFISLFLEKFCDWVMADGVFDV